MRQPIRIFHSNPDENWDTIRHVAQWIGRDQDTHTCLDDRWTKLAVIELAITRDLPVTKTNNQQDLKTSILCFQRFVKSL